MKEFIKNNKVGFAGLLCMFVGFIFPTILLCKTILVWATNLTIGTGFNSFIGLSSFLLILAGFILLVIGLFKPKRLYTLIGFLGVPFLTFLCVLGSFLYTANRLNVTPSELYEAWQKFEEASDQVLRKVGEAAYYEGFDDEGALENAKQELEGAKAPTLYDFLPKKDK